MGDGEHVDLALDLNGREAVDRDDEGAVVAPSKVELRTSRRSAAWHGKGKVACEVGTYVRRPDPAREDDELLRTDSTRSRDVSDVLVSLDAAEEVQTGGELLGGHVWIEKSCCVCLVSVHVAGIYAISSRRTWSALAPQLPKTGRSAASWSCHSGPSVACKRRHLRAE